jgi:hemolysin activation/secretion protein
MANNYGSKFLGPIQGSIKVGMNHSYVLPFNQTDVTVYSADDPKELKFFNLTHSTPLNTYGTKLKLDASHSEAVPGSTQKRLDINGKTNTYQVELSHPILRSRIQNLRVSGGLSIKDNRTDLANSPFVRDKIRTVKAGMHYDRSDSFRGINGLSVTYTKGINGLGSSKNGGSNLSRSKGKVDFSKVEGTLSRYQGLPYDFTLLGMLIGQYTNDILLSAEEFGYGGPAFGRAYDSSEILGERGIAGLVELRYMGVPRLYGANVMPFAFYDFGRVWNLDPGQTNFVNASSGGVGFRAEHNTGVYATFTVAQPMDKHQANPIHGKGGRDPRYGFQLGFRF